MAEVKEAPKPSAEVSESKEQATGVERRSTTTPVVSWFDNPSAFMRRIGEEMDRSFERFFEESGMRMPRLLGRGRELLRHESGLIPGEWSPRVDVLRRGDRLIVRADVPGLTRDDLKVELSDDLLTIQGDRKEEKDEGQQGYSYRECSYGTFYRSIPLPEGVDASNATAEFRDGVLEVAMPAPKAPTKQARRLEVRGGQ